MAHYFFPHLVVNGQVTAEHEYTRKHDNFLNPSWEDGAFLNNNDLRCNKGSMNHRTEPKTYRITAGQDVVGFQAYAGTDGLYHPGPVQIYMSKAPGDVRDYDGSGDWFKVYQLGHRDGSTADDAWLAWKKRQFTFKMPAEIPAGQYLMRMEQAATHQPYTHREFYTQCAHIEVVSNYQGSPSPTFKIPGVYNRDQPFFKYDSWAQPQPTVCPLPGPAMWPNNNNLNKIL
ncbi:fungal cellulose binding domain-containing protein [Stachybotrys elegans]|uniref:lytic cellulose monooxygenase (C4-dehydrogenating) n=1 Tax=Stachybotrys elegans TaxID=80388 RepID=A0A8K0WJ26_9HYPO|nr:fungal cellulose binding domain-containing protein [Stachybotrys elegans]